MKRRLFKSLMCCLALAGLSSCGTEGAYQDKIFLHFKYKLESCGDVQGKDISTGIWFADLDPIYYSDYFSLTFEDSYLDMNVRVDETGKAYGYGVLNIAWKEGPFWQDHVRFDYFGTMTSNTGGELYSDLGQEFHRFVFCIYWVRLNVDFVVPDTNEKIVLTLHFRGGESNPYPPEFDEGTDGQTSSN